MCLVCTFSATIRASRKLNEKCDTIDWLKFYSIKNELIDYRSKLDTEKLSLDTIVFSTNENEKFTDDAHKVCLIKGIWW